MKRVLDVRTQQEPQEEATGHKELVKTACCLQGKNFRYKLAQLSCRKWKSAGNPPYVIKWYQHAVQTCPRFLLLMEIHFQFVHVQINYWRMMFNINPSKASTGDMCHSLPSLANYRTVPYKLGRGDYRRQVLNNNFPHFLPQMNFIC